VYRVKEWYRRGEAEAPRARLQSYVNAVAFSPDGKTVVLKVLPYMSWFPYDSIRKVVYIAGRQHTRQAGGDLVYITQLPHQTQNNTTHIFAQDVRLRSWQPSQQYLYELLSILRHTWKKHCQSPWFISKELLRAKKHRPSPRLLGPAP
jgi:hypothetical protein